MKAHIIIKAGEAQSLTSIERDCSVSPHTVQREINEVAKQFKPHLQALPKQLSFNEFKHARGAMAFEYINVMTGDILDILERRDKQTIKKHFMRNYSLLARKRVETATIDMNAGYQTVITELFPNAEIIIDRFHLVQLINSSMNKCRIQGMNQLKTSNGEDMKKYRRLKRFWKLLLKNAADLSQTEYKYYPLFGQRLEASIVDKLLAYSPILKENYDWYQTLLKAMSNRDFKSLEACLKKPSSQLLSSYMKTSLSTLRKHLPFIKNSFIYPYNNGRIEVINKKKSQIDAACPLPKYTLKSLREKLFLEWTYNSNVIEGNTLTMNEIKVVLEGITIGGKTLREHLEVINHRDAITYVEEIVQMKEPLSEWQIKNLHRLVLKGIHDEYAGLYRKEQVFISGARHTPPAHYLIRENGWNNDLVSKRRCTPTSC